MIMAIDQLAERYGYTPDMDETIEISRSCKSGRYNGNFERNTKSRTYSSLPTSSRKEDFKTRIVKEDIDYMK